MTVHIEIIQDPMHPHMQGLSSPTVHLAKNYKFCAYWQLFCQSGWFTNCAMPTVRGAWNCGESMRRAKQKNSWKEDVEDWRYSWQQQAGEATWGVMQRGGWTRDWTESVPPSTPPPPRLAHYPPHASMMPSLATLMLSMITLWDVENVLRWLGKQRIEQEETGITFFCVFIVL